MQSIQETACNAGDTGLILGSGRSAGEGNGNPFWYSCLGNPLDRGAWRATVHGVARVRHDLVTESPPLPPNLMDKYDWEESMTPGQPVIPF